MAGRVGMSALADQFGWRVAMGTLSVLGLVAAVGFVLLLPQSRRAAAAVAQQSLGMGYHLGAWRMHLQTPGLLPLFLSGFALMGVFVSLFNYAGFRLADAPYGLSQTQIGLVFCVYLFGMVASPAAGALADRWGRAPVLVGGVGLMASGVVLTLAAPLVAVIAGIAVLTFGFFVAHAVASGWVGQLALQSKGHASSLYLLAYYLGSSVLGSAGGWFWEHGHWPALVAFSLVLLVGALALALRLRRAPI